MASGGSRRHLRVLAALVLPAAAGAFSACGPRTDAGDAAVEGRLTLRVTGAQTSAEGNRCVLAVQARNETGSAALNVQAAWMAQTDGFGFISDYQVLGDFAADEERAVQFSIFGAPCSAVQGVDLSRAVCTVGPLQTPPQSCADLVTLDASAIATTPPSR
ncbi:MAG: hypothetical protein M3Z20_00150 [Chloroflexota bacterium]|nr:hypothetical protein [Chloroflexota bacterium]